MDGQVKILFTNGEYYEGQFKNNVRNGTGSQYYLNGDVYEGPWDMDRRGGKNRGRIKFKDGSSMDAKFILDKADGDVEFQDKEGNVYFSEAEKKDSRKKQVDMGSF